MKIRDRIKELRTVKASELLPNPRNWRTHPNNQLDALRGVLSEVGWAGAALVRETPDGLQLIDGHARAELADEIPCLILDITEDEANLILATYDPLTTMAGVDDEALADLIKILEVSSQSVLTMLDDLATKEGIVAEEIQTDYQPGDSDSKGLRQFVVVLTPDQFEEIKATLDRIIAEGLADNPDNPNRLGNALHYAVIGK